MPQIDLKLLIDSGASNSIISPKPAFEKFKNFMFKENFRVSTIRDTIRNDDNVCYPILKELGIDYPIQFCVVDWHNHFDALIGSEDLQNLNAKIDYQDNTLKIGNTCIPFILGYTSRKVAPQKIKTTNILKIPVSIENGDVILPELKLTDKLVTPESILTADQGYCTLPVDQPIEINFNERIQVTPLFHSDILEPPRIKMKPNILKLIRTNHLNDEERKRILDLCKKFNDIFYNENSSLSFTNAIKHNIRTTDETPVFARSFRHPYKMKDEIQKQVQKLLDNDVIQPSISPYSAPVWIVPKKTDASGQKKFRMVIDYRKLNEKTIEDKYPIPRIDEILDNLGKCSYFSTLDLAQGFHQIEMDKNSIEKTAFTVNN